MTQFSSRPQFNDDPQPLVHPSGKRTPAFSYHFEYETGESGVFGKIAPAKFDPRPEYDRPQHNPTNPILVFARQHPDANIMWSYLPFRPTDDMIAHAGKVLRRRADLRLAAEVEALFPKESA